MCTCSVCTSHYYFDGDDDDGSIVLLLVSFYVGPLRINQVVNTEQSCDAVAYEQLSIPRFCTFEINLML